MTSASGSRWLGYLTRLERYDDAEAQLATAARLADSDEQKNVVLEARG